MRNSPYPVSLATLRRLEHMRAHARHLPVAIDQTPAAEFNSFIAVTVAVIMLATMLFALYR